MQIQINDYWVTDLSDEPSDKHHELVHAPLVDAEPLPTQGAHTAFDEQQGVGLIAERI